MKHQKQWLNEALHLCGEIGPEDGIDPRILARKYEKENETRHHKSMQLCKEAKRVLSLVLAGELADPLFQQLQVIDVITDEEAQFLIVTLDSSSPDHALDEAELISRLQQIQGYLRSVIAQSVKRKRVPTLKFCLHATGKVTNNAYTKNN